MGVLYRVGNATTQILGSSFAIAVIAGLLTSISSAQDTVNRDDRWTKTASNSTTGALGDPVTLTWSLVRENATVNGQANHLISHLDSKWNVIGGSPTSFESRPWFDQIKQGFERWGEISGLTYNYEQNDNGTFSNNSSSAAGQLGVRGDVRVAGYSQDGPFGTLAFNYFPNNGDMVLDTDETSAYASASRLFRNTISHEAGHGIGLSHTIGTGFLMNPSIITSFEGPQFHDILAVQRGYGDALEKNGGNDTTNNATGLGTIAIGGSMGKGFDTPDLGGSPTSISVNQTDFVSIDDNSDTDYFKFSVTGRSQADFVLNPRGPSYSVGPQGGTATTFNASQRSDLVLTIFDDHGNQLSKLDSVGAGGNESISGFKLTESGDYYARVTGKVNEAQMYSFEVSVNNAQAVTDSGLVFRDTYNVSGGNEASPNSFRQGTARQGPGIVDSRYDTSSTDTDGTADTSVSISGNRLQLSSSGDGSGANQAIADLNRNFLPQLENQIWNMSFDVELDFDSDIGDSWFGLTFNDDLPIGLPFSNDAELAILLRGTGAYTARENGGTETGELSTSGNIGPLTGLNNFNLLVDETGVDTLLSLYINNSPLIESEIINLNSLGRYFSFRSHVGATSTAGLSLNALVDNLEIRVVSVPEPAALPLLMLTMGLLVRRRRTREPGLAPTPTPNQNSLSAKKRPVGLAKN